MTESQKLMPGPEHAAAQERDGIASGQRTDDLMAGLAEAWRTVLEVDEIEEESHFFELGGHSMLAALLISHCERAIGTVIPLKLVFDHPVFKDFVAAVEQADGLAGSLLPPLEPMGLDRAPLSVQQGEYLALERMLGVPSVNNMLAVVEVGAHMDADALRSALDAVVRRHPALRTALRTQDGEDMQVIVPLDDVPPVPCTETDLGTLPPERRRAALRNRIMREHLKPFDMATGVMLRCQLFRNADAPDVLALHLHHAVCDGNCVGVVLDDLAAACVGRELPTADPEEPGHLDYCQWQRENEREMVETSGSHWRSVVRELAAVASTSAGPTARLRTSFDRSTAWLPASASRRLRTWAAAEGLTEFSTLGAATALAVGRVLKRTTAGLGMLLDNRSHPGLERTVGSFALSSLMPVRLDGALTSREFISQVQESHLEARRWTQLPLDVLLVDPADEVGVTPSDLIDVVVDFEYVYRMNRPGRLPLHVGVDLREMLRAPVLGPRRTVTATIQEDDRFALTVEHVDDPGERETAHALLAAAIESLAFFADAPDETVGRMADA